MRDDVFLQPVVLKLSKAEALVLFEMVADIREESAVAIKDTAERQAIWNVAGSFESSIVELFHPNYAELVAEAKRRLTQK